MEKHVSPNKKSLSLREQAEELLASKKAQVREIKVDDPQALIHELQVHQIELEMQNDELRTAQENIENSRRRYSDLYDYAPVGYLTIDIAEKITKANLTASQLLGYDRFYLFDKPLTSFIFREDQDILYHHVRRLQDGMSHTCEIRLSRKDGSNFNAKLESVPFKDGSNEIQEFLMAISDISERKHAEKMQTRLSSIVEGADDAVTSETLDGIITSWNAGAEKIYGYTEDEVKGKPLSILTPPDRLEELSIILRKVVAGESVQNFETNRKKKDGSEFPVSVTISPIKTEEGKVIGASTIAHDITDRKKWEESILDLNHRLQISNRELESLGHVLSHDLRAPVRGIVGFATIIKDDYSTLLDEKGEIYVQSIINMAHRMDMMVAALLKISRIARAELTRENIDLSNVIRNVAQELSEQEPDRHVEFSIQGGITVTGDAPLIRMAVENLLRNAWKFTKKQPKALIEFGVTDSHDKRAFFVSDNGAGFNMNYADRLFVVFQRLHGEKDFEGTGIGLATVQRIILRHGGEIWADGEIDKGATFYFTLK